ncbi:MAG: YfgM family protein [Pseudomonadota bacterium]
MEYATEEERLEAIRDWWKRWGKVIIAVILMGILAIVGTRYWMEQQAAQGEAASTLYGRMMLLAESGDWEAADDMGGRLMEEFTGTPYSPLAALVRARAALAEGERETALSHLEWAEKRAEPESLRTLARIRRARIRLDGGDAERALSLAEEAAEATPAYRAGAREVAGDALHALGRHEEALEAYLEARELGGSPTLPMKIDDLNTRIDGDTN